MIRRRASLLLLLLLLLVGSSGGGGSGAPGPPGSRLLAAAILPCTLYRHSGKLQQHHTVPGSLKGQPQVRGLQRVGHDRNSGVSACLL